MIYLVYTIIGIKIYVYIYNIYVYLYNIFGYFIVKSHAIQQFCWTNLLEKDNYIKLSIPSVFLIVEWGNGKGKKNQIFFGNISLMCLKYAISLICLKYAPISKCIQALDQILSKNKLLFFFCLTLKANLSRKGPKTFI